MAEDDKSESSNDCSETSFSFKFCQFVVNRNLLALSLALLAQTSFPVVTAILYFCNSDVLPIDFTDIPLILFDEPSYRRAVAWSARNRDVNEPMTLDPSFLNDSEIRQQLIYRQYTADYIELYYEIDQAGDGDEDRPDAGNILTEPYLRRIAQFENSLLRLPYYEKFCVLKRLSECQPVDSLVQYLPFLDSIDSKNSSTPPTTSDRPNSKNVNDQIWRTVMQMGLDPALKPILGNYLGLDTRLDAYPPRSTKLRSIFRVSWVNYETPFPVFRANDSQFWGLQDNGDDKSAPRMPHDTKAFAQDILSPAFWNYCLNGIPDGNRDSANSSEPKSDIRFYYYNMFLYYDRLRYQCWEDEVYAFGSLAFIAAFLWFQTRSLLLAALGMYFILTNFIGGNLFYRYVFDYRYFGVFNALAIFLVLAVGVDEIFVFEETWSATGERTYPSLAHRLHDCYRKCSLSIFVPTLATTIALVQTALCPLMALSSFGSFAACVVVLNYISIVSYFPCVLIFYHTRIDSSCRRRGQLICGSIAAGSRNPNSIPRAHRLSQKACNAYFALLRKPGVQALFLVLTALGLGFLIYSSTNLSIDRDPPNLYTEAHPLGAALKRKQRDYPSPLHHRDSQFVQIYFVWGIKDWDRSRCHRNEWKSCAGRIVWDDNFDLNPFPAQFDLLNICKRLRNLTKSERDELMVRTSKTDGEAEIACFMDDMDAYFHEEMRVLLYEEQKRLGGLPSTQVKVEALMLHVPQIYNLTQLLQNPFFYRYFEIANLYWLNDGYKFLFPKIQFSPSAFRRHALLVGHSLNISDLKTARYGSYSFVYGTRLRYAAIVINTTVPKQGLRYDEGLGVFQKWEDFFEELKSDIKSPHLRQSGFVITPDTSGDFGSGIWHWLVVQKVLITSAWQGVLIGVGLALPILILFTDDFVVGALTTFTIACTSVSIIGVIPLAGWKLGLLESLNLTLVADLAIDHIVHVAEGYQLSKKPTRKEKVEELLHEAGISIVSGALTTVGASVFLLFAKIVFFMQFGLFILFTVGFSVVFSLGMFVILLTLVGPEDDRYSISKWVRRMKTKIKKTALKRLSDDKDCQKLQLVGYETDAQNGHLPCGQSEDTVYKPSVCADGTNSSHQVFAAASSCTPASTPETKKSADDDSISSGYESTGVALARFDASYNSSETARVEEISSQMSSSSSSGDAPASRPMDDQRAKSVQVRHHRSRDLAGYGVKHRTSRATSARARNSASLRSASRKIVPVDAAGNGQVASMLGTKSKSVTDMLPSSPVLPVLNGVGT